MYPLASFVSCLDGGWIEEFFCSLGQISVWFEAVLAARDVRSPSAEVRLTVLLLVQVVQTNANKHGECCRG